MRDLIDAAWANYRAFERSSFVVTPSIPILFFGDLQAYRRSERKIVTAALNPSRIEFPADDRFRRFRAVEGLHDQMRQGQHHAGYIEALSSYFRCDPYRRWFNCFEPLLNGMHASYYGSHPNVALQTDLCSPLATDPTWKGLDPTARQQLMADGVELWHRLIELLAPDMIVVSLAWAHVAKIRFGRATDWRVLATRRWRKDGTRLARPHIVQEQQIVVGHRRIPLIFARAAHKPLGFLTDDDKVRLGRMIVALLDTEKRLAELTELP